MNDISRTTLLIGIGNAYRHDDGVGLVIARRLQALSLPAVTVFEHSGEGAALLEAWKGYSIVFLVDAVESGAPAGTLHRLNAQTQPIPRELFHHSTHAFGVADAIELARALNQLPPLLVLYGIEGKDYTAGLGLSAEVDQAATAVVARILGEIEAFQTSVAADVSRL